MKKILIEHKNKILIIALIIFLGIIYFSYNMTTTWDSSEYLGLADYIGAEEMTEKWIGHRGIAFPLLLKLFKPFGIENKIFMLTLMFIFYIGMVIILYKIYKKLKELDFFKSKITKYLFAIYAMIFIILNPMIFGYYHTLLTEFVSMTITLLTCYLSWKWIDLLWKENRKSVIVYTIIFSLLTIFLYHIKQSLVSLTILPVIISALISIINNFKISNILTRTVSILTVGVMLISSIFAWNFAMKDANVAEDTNNNRVKNRLIIGIRTLKQICDDETIDEIEIEEEKLSTSDREKINNVISNESKYKKFKIYETSDSEYLVYFSKGDYTFKEDIGFYVKVLFSSPLDIVKSYYKNYWSIIFYSKDWPIWRGKENYNIPYRIYQNRENVVDVNKDYEEYIANYRSVNETNIVSNIFNKYAFKSFKFITVFTKLSLWILPILWIISIIVYTIIHKKINSNNLKVLQLVVILYTTSFVSILSYIMFGTSVDRYTVPMMIPTFIAHFLSLVLLTRIEIKKKN